MRSPVMVVLVYWRRMARAAGQSRMSGGIAITHPPTLVRQRIRYAISRPRKATDAAIAPALMNLMVGRIVKSATDGSSRPSHFSARIPYGGDMGQAISVFR